ncbi:hypothetical protein L1987_71678 [Smallanthus sonchifolius]|uniref:Uncharacterized protein n=1 Tax=Smallanthus sonchifolius TaxID=185202 RepID=A0ACB9ASB1_9ASTR|nr:hypothetical protein L1987_71678 [Smallanthus sonchifolius]
MTAAAPTTAMSSSSSSLSSSFWRFDSPLIYLFGGIAAMLALIVVALVILACSQRNRRSATAGLDIETGKATKLREESHVSPKFVVIMAGDNVPTYLAAPAGVK